MRVPNPEKRILRSPDPAAVSPTETGIQSLLNQFECEPVHVHHVQHLALNLFDSLNDWHRYGPTERDQLRAAALLHDIGWANTQPDGRRHHKESARLIREHSWQETDGTWVERVALVARFHRKSCPAKRHADFMRLAQPDQERVRFLAALLRVADGLDRRHLQMVEATEGVWTAQGLCVKAIPAQDPDIEVELLGASKKADLLRQLAARVEFQSVAAM
jgi:exopolyphosphatase/guanosine-5'-triphosphate,3'-diphosphate pyrophosphatase